MSAGKAKGKADPPKVASARARPLRRATAGASDVPPAARRAKPLARGRVRPPTPEEHLQRALQAPSPRSRSIWARRGLATRAPLDRTTHVLLLRQLYLGHYEQRHFRRALEVAEQALAVGEMEEFLHHDAARALQALGELEAAAGHLRLAARRSPPNRRAFHWWTLGSLLYLAGRHDDAETALERACRWGTKNRPLYRAHLAVVRAARGEGVDDVAELCAELAETPSGEAYGRFVLGQLAASCGRHEEARRHLSTFLRKTRLGRPAVAIALEPEMAAALATLSRIPHALD